MNTLPPLEIGNRTIWLLCSHDTDHGCALDCHEKATCLVHGMPFCDQHRDGFTDEADEEEVGV